MSIQLTILGSSSAVPTKTRNTSSQFLSFLGHYFLVDCGESSMHTMIRQGLPFVRLDYIFISHLHTDHILGLPGLLSSLSLKNRTKPLVIYSPKGLKELIQPLIGQKEYFSFELSWVELDTTVHQTILDESDYTVETIPLFHRVPTMGYLFREKQKSPNVRKDAIEKYHLTIEQIKAAKNNQPVYVKGHLIDADKLVVEARPPRSYAYCSDTMFNLSIAERVKGVTMIYHEATYLDELRDLAKARGHATSLQAAQIAQIAGVQKLLLGHFSTRYQTVNPLEQEAQSIFSATTAVEDGDVFDI